MLNRVHSGVIPKNQRQTLDQRRQREKLLEYFGWAFSREILLHEEHFFVVPHLFVQSWINRWEFTPQGWFLCDRQYAEVNHKL